MLDTVVSNTIDTLLYVPVLKRYWKQHELWDGTYTLSDLLDILEAINVHEENKNIIINYELDKIKQ